MPVYLSPPPRSPLARAAAAVIGAVAMVGAFMVGAAAFLVMLGIALVGGIWFWFRTRDVRRALREAASAEGNARPPGDTIEAEYTVVTRRETEQD